MKISGLRLVLRDERQETDDEDLFRWLNMEEWKYYDEPDVPFAGVSREEFKKMVEGRRPRPGKRSPWQIDTAQGQHIGWVNFYRLDEKAKQIYIGICLPEEETWGRGYGAEALRLVIDHLFAEMGIEDIRAETWTGNKRMLRVAEKCGFREIGRTPYEAEYSVRGEPLERIEFAISHQEWLARKDSSG